MIVYVYMLSGREGEDGACRAMRMVGPEYVCAK